MSTILLVVTLAFGADAGATPDGGEPDVQASGPNTAVQTNHVMVPPVPLQMPTIAYPSGAPPLLAPVDVEVVITIDDKGAVTDVEVARSARDDLDRAVVEGAKRFVFAPAMQDGVATAVRVPFTQHFVPPPPPAAPTTIEPALDAVIEGSVVTRGSRAPIASATVVARDAVAGRDYLTTSDGGGKFKLPVRSGRALEVRIVAAEHETFVQKEQLGKDQRLKVRYLVDRKSYGQFESFVRTEPDRTEVSRTTLSGREITRVPGTFGDPFRVINILPGVSSAMGLLPLPIVRGSSPGNTGMLLDGVRMPLLFHLLAGPSVIHPEFIDHIDFYPGGFPVRYGGYTGGIVDGVTRPAKPDEHRVDLDFNLTQTGGLVREPIKAIGATATVAARLGYPGILLSLLNPNVSLSFWDYQARLDGGQTSSRWSVFFYGAQDELKRRPAAGQDFENVAHYEFHRLALRYQHADGGSSEQYRLVFGYDNSVLGGTAGTPATGNAAIGNGSWSASPQIRIQRTLASWLQLSLGIQEEVRSITNPPSLATTSSNVATDLSKLVNKNGVFSTSSAFAEFVVKPTSRLWIIPGLRADLYDESIEGSAAVTQWSVDPRLLARYHLWGQPTGGTWIKGVIGRYHQPPRFFVPVPGLDSSSLDLGLLASTQYSVGTETVLGSVIDADINAYYNAMDPVIFDLTVNPSAADVQQAQPANLPWDPAPSMGRNDRALSGLFTKRVGRSYGLEVLLRKHDAERLFGWVSYTLSRSERRSDTGAWEPFDFDRLHIFNFVSGLRLPRNWEVGARVLMQTGTPLTTIFGHNDVRSNGQFRVDLRLDKRAVWNKWLLDFYVDIINATVAEESGGIIGGSAIRYLVPTLGLRAVL